MPAETYFLEGRLSPPYLRPNKVDRIRLLQQFDNSPNIRLVLVCAPAGYGKSTLLADWHMALLDKGSTAAWIQLEPYDNDPLRFISLICFALRKALTSQTIEKEIIDRELDLLANTSSKDADTTLKLLVNLLPMMQAPVVIIFDDFHLITHPGVHQALAFLLDHLPPNVKVAIGSRADPPLPLARLRARGELIELRLSDLRFSSSEVEIFIKQTLGVSVEETDLKLVEQCTEGWVVGLQLIGLSLRNWPDWTKKLLQPGESHHTVSTYLAEEVFRQLNPEIQQFLLNTSILDTLSASLCDAVSSSLPGGRRAAEILAWLEQENLFVIPLDPFSRHFRYHPLFAEFLRASLTSRDPAAAAQLNFRASQWYWANEQIEPAIRHALQAYQPEWLVHLTEQAGIFMVARSELSTLNVLLSYLPAESMQDNPLLLIIRAWEQMLQGHLDRVDLDLFRAAALLKDLPASYGVTIPGYPMTKATFTGHITALRAFVARIRTKWEEGISLSEQALQELPEDEQLVRSTLVFNLAQVYKERHQVEPARKYFAESVRLGKSAGNIYIHLLALAFLGQLAALQGQMSEAETYYRQALKLGYREDGSVAVPAVGYAEAWLGDWYILQGKLSPARVHIERSIRLAELCGEYGIQHVAYLAAARLCVAEKKIAAALSWVEKTENIPLDGIHADLLWIEAHRGTLLLAQGYFLKAARWAENLPQKIEPGQITRSSEKYLLAKIQAVLVAAQHKVAGPEQISSALDILARLRSEAEMGGRIASLVEILLLQAGLLVESGQASDARHCLDQARRLADPQGWSQIFQDIPVNILEQVDRPGNDNLLTEREVELVRLIASGLTNQEIAERLFITVGTVKSHLNHIFSKLEARHRAEAIARARKLNLI